MNMLKGISLAAGLALGLGAADAGTLRYSGIHFFGDSLSDPGNLAALAPFVPGIDFPAAFPLGKASDGDLWSEIIAREFLEAGLRASNTAFAGARAFPDDAIPALGFPGINLPSQILRFQTAVPVPLPGNDLAAIWVGNNDMLGLVRGATLTPEGGLSDADRALLAAQAAGLAGFVVNTAALLTTSGISDFVFMKLPDFGLIPRYALPEPFGDPARAGVASLASDLFNAALDDAVAALTGLGARASIFDFDTALRGAFADPGALGVTQPLLPCLAVIGPTPAIADLLACREHFFYDDIHPTAALHARLAEEFRSFVVVSPMPIPLPAAGWLLLAALAGLGGLARVRRRA